jgi:hypothetical protein
MEDNGRNATGVSPQTSGGLESRLNTYINPAAFSPAPQFTFGNVSRFIGMLGPGQAKWDMSLFKSSHHDGAIPGAVPHRSAECL